MSLLKNIYNINTNFSVAVVFFFFNGAGGLSYSVENMLKHNDCHLLVRNKIEKFLPLVINKLFTES